MAATMSHLLRCYTSEYTRDAYVTPRTSHTPPIHSSPSSSFILFFSSSLKMASVTSKLFGHHGGQDVHEYTLDNGNGTEASIITYGAILRKLLVKGACSVPPSPPSLCLAAVSLSVSERACSFEAVVWAWAALHRSVC